LTSIVLIRILSWPSQPKSTCSNPIVDLSNFARRTFTPKIDKKSKELVRDRPVDELLYADAERR